MLELNKIYNIDCFDGMEQLDDNSIDAIITDPPYNIGKDEWDRIDNYCDWFISIAKECNRVLKDNGTFWFFHMDFDILSKIHNRLIDETSFRHKQMIIIDKGKQSIAGRTSDMLRSYPRATEYLQFYTFNDPTGAEQLGDQYAKVNPMAKYLKDEFERAGVTNKKIAKLFPSNTGGLTGCVSNWLIGYNFPTKEQYNKMRQFLNYEYLRKEYEDLRYPFNLQTGYTDVWKINFYKEKNNGHCTQKPLSLMQRIVKTSTLKDMVVCDPFSGVGSTALACRQLDRKYICFEIDTKYCDIANKRLLNVPERLDKWIESK